MGEGGKMKARVTLIVARKDKTWHTMEVVSGGANWQNIMDNALESARMQLGFYAEGKYPDNIISIWPQKGTMVKEK